MGVAAFIGFATPALPEAPKSLMDAGLAALPVEITLWPEFAERFGSPPGFLGEAVRCFFANGGEVCHIAALRPGASPALALAAALQALAAVDAVDLVCAPDVVWRPGARSSDPVTQADAAAMLSSQAAIIDHCEALGDRFALLDSLPALAVGDPHVGGVLWQRAAHASDMAALYYPWLSASPGAGAVPPCGHVAGVIARLDVHRAPANVPLEAAIELQATLAPRELGRLNDAGVNALRAVPGRGIRVWGARTLSNRSDWRHVNVRRLVIALGRWARDALAPFTFEPNDARLWGRLQLAIEVRLEELFRSGALAGATPAEAYYVHCEGSLGQVVAEVGLAPAAPNEFIVVHIVRDASGVSVAPG
jgi:hypothetical protein